MLKGKNIRVRLTDRKPKGARPVLRWVGMVLVIIIAFMTQGSLKAQETVSHTLEFLWSDCRAYQRRVQWIRSARSSIQIGSYHWREDTIGQTFATELIKAAERGVRIRILIDAWRAFDGLGVLSFLDEHPLIEVRLYNPPVIDAPSRQDKPWPFAASLDWFIRMNTRFHQKLFLVDGVRMIIGGRNWTDEYFGLDPHRRFFDVDCAIEGGIAADALSDFERVWRQPLSVPLSRLPKLFIAAFGRAQPFKGKTSDGVMHEICLDENENDLGQLDEEPFVTHKPVVYWSTQPLNPVKQHRDVQTWLKFLFEPSGQERLFITPYFHPWRVTKRFRPIVLTLITNSWETAPSRWAQALCEQQIVQMRTPHSNCPIWLAPRLNDKKPQFSVHAKFYLIQDKGIFIGSANFDPRSMMWNWENGVFVKDPYEANRLAVRLHAFLDNTDVFVPQTNERFASRPFWEFWLRRLILLFGKFTIPLI